MMRSRRSLISTSGQKKLEKSCTHSEVANRYPPALAMTSGTTVIPRSWDVIAGCGWTIGTLDHQPGRDRLCTRGCQLVFGAAGMKMSLFSAELIFGDRRYANVFR